MKPYARMQGMRSVAELAADKPHGTRMKYRGGCRCDECRKANSAYENERQKARRAGDWNGIVPADRARAHLRKLARVGVGRNIVAQCSGVARSIVHAIRHGQVKRIRARTERRILAVTTAQRGDAALVPAARVWQLLHELLEEGYTRPFINQQLGYRTKYAFQFSRKLVQVRTLHRIERLHERLTT